MSNDILDKYDRSRPKAEVIVEEPADAGPDIFAKFDRKPVENIKEKGKPTKVIREVSPRGEPVNMSGFNNRMASSVPILGPLFDKATAAVGAAVQPLVNEEARSKTFGQRYGENLAMQDERNRLYEESNPAGAIAADVAGSGMLLGPLSQTALGARMMGMSGNSLGARVYQGAAGMGGLETANQLLKGNNPVEQGMFGPVPLAAAGGAVAPMVGEAIAAGGNRLLGWLPRKTGELAGVNSTGRGMLTNAIEGETPASIAAARQRMGPAGMLADVNHATTDLAGGLADIPGPHKQVVREAFRQRSAGQADRIQTAMDTSFGPRTNVLETTRAIRAERAAQSDPLYAAWRDTRVDPTPELKALLPRLEAADVISAARAKAAKEGVPFDRNFFTPGQQKNFPTAQSWDYVKRGLDSKIATAQRGGDYDEVRILTGLRRDLVQSIDNHPNSKVAGVWREARHVFAHHSSLMEQLEAGQHTFSRNYRVEDLASELRGLSRPELEARIQGARDAVQKIMGDSVRGDTTARNMLLAENSQDKLRLLLGPQRANQLIDTLESEVAIRHNTQNVTGGSQTTPKKERTNAILPAPTEMGYLSNINVTKPASFVPEWMKPQTIMEGARAERHANAYQQMAPLLTRRMSDPKFNDLVNELLAEHARQGLSRDRMNRFGTEATRILNVAAPALRNRLLDDPDARKQTAQGRR